MTLLVQGGGSGDQVLLLLHGLGATGDVWRDASRHWPGRWLAPDLPGHGGSGQLSSYSFEGMADEVAGLVDREDRVVVLGHSLGGVLGLVLAARLAQVSHVLGLGIKVSWSAADLAQAAELAGRPVAWFETRAEAVERYRRVSGSADLVSDDVAASGVREIEGRWRLALDPATFAVGAPDMPRLLEEATAPVTLARGEHDVMVSHEQLAALVDDPVDLPGLGHNAHLENPAAVFALLRT